MEKEEKILAKMEQNTGKVTGNESGKREIHPYVRPGICTILVSLTCFFASLIAFNTTSKYDEKICANQTKPEVCTSQLRKFLTVYTFYYLKIVFNC